jgi:hypothetical protein
MAIDPMSEGPGPAITPRACTRTRHVFDHCFIGPACDDWALEIWGYSDRITFSPGDSVALHVSTTAATSEWVAGLARGARLVDRITRNVLDRFGVR